ncbi:MAG: response regulator [Micromonosporaceae bacterium]|jgi:PAS domain S-box-containing protein
MTGARTRVVVADDDRTVRQALADLVSARPDLEVVGTAGDHPEAVRQAVRYRPDVLVLDDRMPGGSAADTLRAVRHRAPQVAVLVVSGYGDPTAALDAVAAGAVGYLVKEVADRELPEAVARGVRGQLSMPAPLAWQCAELVGARRREGGVPAAEHLLEHSPDATLVVDSSGRIELVNAAAERLFGYSRRELVGSTVDVLMPFYPAGGPEGARPAGPSRMELTGRRRDGTEFPVDLGVGPVPDGGRIMLTGRDMTEIAGSRDVLERSVESLRASDREHRAVLEDLVRAQEGERRRIAAGIHDDSLQVITAASLRLQQLRRRLRDPDDLKTLSQVEETVRLAADRLRRLIFDFRPPALEEDGLETALRILLDQLREETGIAYELDSQLERQPPLESRVVAYRIAQEALANVRKHAQARRVTVRLRTADDGCLVEVADDGVGFTPQRAETRAGHLGLTLMRDRAEIVGGWWRINSTPGAGTVVEFWVPFQLASVRGEL